MNIFKYYKMLRKWLQILGNAIDAFTLICIKIKLYKKIREISNQNLKYEFTNYWKVLMK